jgi:ribokinase
MGLPEDLLGTVDLLVPNRSEAARLAGLPTDSSPDRLLEAILVLAHGDVVLTLGAEGALLGRQGRERVHVLAPVVPVLDTTGAGDAFCGALAVALAQGVGIEAAVRLAVRAGGHAVTIEEAVPAFPRPAHLGLAGQATALR